MNLSELSDLVKVTEHLKDIINTAGMSRFSNATLAALKNRLKDFDEKFIDEMLNYESNNQSTAKAIHNAIQDARQKMGLEPPPTPRSEPEQESRKPAKKSKTEKLETEPYLTSVASPLDKSVELAAMPVEVKQEEVKKELPKVVPSSVKQPYLEDESLAAMLAAERQKVAAKKRK